MLTEDYCDFETAKLLKEKGFNEPCVTQYDKKGNFEYGLGVRNSDLIDNAYKAPTLQMAVKWLREVHNIDIFPWKIGKGIYSCAIFDSNNGKDLSSNKDFPSEKYEGTVEAAIRYCLENLI